MQKIALFLSGSNRTYSLPYLCPLYITGLVLCSGYPFSGLRMNYHIFWVMKVIIYRLSISSLKQCYTFWSYLYEIPFWFPPYLETVLDVPTMPHKSSYLHLFIQLIYTQLFIEDLFLAGGIKENIFKNMSSLYNRLIMQHL